MIWKTSRSLTYTLEQPEDLARIMSPRTSRNIRLFAGLKEAAGRSHMPLECPEGATPADLKGLVAAAYPEIASLADACRVAVGGKFVADDAPLPAEGEIALIPPVSGGQDVDRAPLDTDDDTASDRSRSACLTTLALDSTQVAREVAMDTAGATTTFVGNVRSHSRGLIITHLDYEAYRPMALRVMQEIVDDIESDVEGARVAIHHRLGRLVVGEAAVVIAASAPHRAEAFDACRRAIEALKRDVPIWKKEFDAQGGSWIGQGP